MSKIVGFVGKNYYIHTDDLGDLILYDKAEERFIDKGQIDQKAAREIIEQKTLEAINAAKQL